jgi:ferric-dicitrate binding protein FerR (iron transport regulator)
MADSRKLIVEILVKHTLHQPLSRDEQGTLDAWRRQSEEHGLLPDLLQDGEWLAEHRRHLERAPSEEMWAEISLHVNMDEQPAVVVEMPPRHEIRRRIGWWLASLAAAILLGTGIWMLWRPQNNIPTALSRPMILPVQESQALLIRDGGNPIDLDSVKIGGVVVREGPMLLRKTDSNGLAYEATTKGYDDVIINTRHQLAIGTRRGPWRVRFADGSRVWLNKGASLGYPLDLRSGEPPILDGEGWFSMIKDAHRPFEIYVGKGESAVVLGTSFDADSRTGRVALFSGAVRVRRGEDSVVLRPGHEVRMGSEGSLEIYNGVDSLAELAWMRPKVATPWYDFDNASLAKAAEEIGAWWRLRVSNPDHVEGATITGRIDRNQSLQTTLDELSRVEHGYARISVEEDSILIMPFNGGQ